MYKKCGWQMIGRKLCSLTVVCSMMCVLSGCGKFILEKKNVEPKTESISAEKAEVETEVDTESETEAMSEMATEAESDKSASDKGKTAGSFGSDIGRRAAEDITEETTSENAVPQKPKLPEELRELESGGVRFLTDRDWKEIYLNEWTDELMEPYSDIQGTLYDVDGNGIPELFIAYSTGAMERGLSVNTCCNAEMVDLGGFGGTAFQICAGNGYLLTKGNETLMPSDLHIEISKVSYGSIQTLVSETYSPEEVYSGEAESVFAEYGAKLTKPLNENGYWHIDTSGDYIDVWSLFKSGPELKQMIENY